MGKQRAYNKEYKVQAVKLAHEIGSTKAANELGIPINTCMDGCGLKGWEGWISVPVHRHHKQP